MMIRCPTCPVADGLRCPGEHPPGSPSRLCRLADPGDPLHRAAYRASIPEAAAQLGRREYPSLAERARSLARAVWAWAVDGFAMARRAEVDRRLAICSDCPEWVAADRKCRLCGCNSDAKVRMRASRCPADPPRW